jgi:hypothetical protein
MYTYLSVLEPDDSHIGLKCVVRKKTVNCECVKVTDKNQQEYSLLVEILIADTYKHTSILH